MKRIFLIIILFCATLGRADLVDFLNHRPSQTPLCVFYGCFDPLHAGHLVPMRAAKKAYPKAVFVLVLVPDEQPQKKHQRTWWERYHRLREVLKDQPDVYVTRRGIGEVHHLIKHRPNPKIGIVGSDRALQKMHTAGELILEWFVSLRGEAAQFPDLFAAQLPTNRKVVLVHPPKDLWHINSTLFREQGILPAPENGYGYHYMRSGVAIDNKSRTSSSERKVS